MQARSQTISPPEWRTLLLPLFICSILDFTPRYTWIAGQGCRCQTPTPSLTLRSKDQNVLEFCFNIHLFLLCMRIPSAAAAAVPVWPWVERVPAQGSGVCRGSRVNRAPQQHPDIPRHPKANRQSPRGQHSLDPHRTIYHQVSYSLEDTIPQITG